MYPRVILVIFVVGLGGCSGITTRRLERRVNLLESRIHDDSLTFREDLDKVFAIVNNSIGHNDLSLDGTEAKISTCSEQERGSDAVAELLSDIDDQIISARRGMSAEKVWLRTNVDALQTSIAEFTREVGTQVSIIEASVGDVKAEINETCVPLMTNIRNVSEKVDAMVQTWQRRHTLLSDTTNGQIERLEASVEELATKIETKRESLENQGNTNAKFLTYVLYNTILKSDVTFKVYDGHFYFAGKNTLTWIQAREKCNEVGAHLVEIESREENSFLGNNFEEHFYWIGANDRVSEGVWEWAYSKHQLAFSVWRPTEPNDYGGEDCVHAWRYKIGDSFVWNDDRCSIRYSYICEYP